MINIFDIAELKYLIMEFLDIKSLGRTICLNKSTKNLVESMPIYQEIMMSLPSELSNKFLSDMFVNACQYDCIHLVKNIVTNYKHKILNVMNYALVDACRNGHLLIVQFLVESGVNLHDHDDWGLRCASEYGHLPVVKYLVENGADVHARYDFSIWAACVYNHPDVANYLATKGGVIYASDHYVLKWACEKCHVEIVKFLVDYGIKIGENFETYYFLNKNNLIKN